MPAKSDRFARKTWLETAASKLLPSEVKVSLNPLMICNGTPMLRQQRMLPATGTFQVMPWPDKCQLYQPWSHNTSTKTNQDLLENFSFSMHMSYMPFTNKSMCPYAGHRAEDTECPVNGQLTSDVCSSIVVLGLPRAPERKMKPLATTACIQSTSRKEDRSVEHTAMGTSSCTLC